MNRSIGALILTALAAGCGQSSSAPPGSPVLKIAKPGCALASPALVQQPDCQVDVLPLPVGATQAAAFGQSSSTDARVSHIQLSTSMSVDDVVRHYVGRMTPLGWVAQSPMNDGAGLAAIHLTSATPAGSDEALTALLTASQIPQAQAVDLQLRILRNKSSVKLPRAPASGAGRGLSESARSGGAGARAHGTVGTIPRDILAVLEAGHLTLDPTEYYDVRATAPADFPNDLLPNAMVNAAALSRSLTTVVATSMLAREAASRYLDDIAASGWIIGTWPFLFKRFDDPLSVEVCREAQVATVSFHPRAAGGSFVRIELAKATQACAGGTNRPAVTLPVLFPESTYAMGASGGGGGGPKTATTHTLVGSPNDASAIGAHYTKEMVLAGWASRGQVVDALGFVGHFESKTPDGTPVTGILTVTQTAQPNAYDLSFTWSTRAF